MLHEEHLGSDAKKSSCNTSTRSGRKPVSGAASSGRTSWAEEVNHFENSRNSGCSKSGKFASCSNTLARNSSSPERELAFEFIDGANERKFERLMKDEKVKTPFKRSYSRTPSDGSRSQSPSGSYSDVDFVGFKGEKRQRHNSYASSSSSSVDDATLTRRQKQIDYGKNTRAYSHYLELVPRSERTRDNPSTPDKYGKYSRRAFDGLVKSWRKKLHYYDPPTEKQRREDASSNSDSDSD